MRADPAADELIEPGYGTTITPAASIVPHIKKWFFHPNCTSGRNIS